MRTGIERQTAVTLAAFVLFGVAVAWLLVNGANGDRARESECVRRGGAVMRVQGGRGWVCSADARPALVDADVRARVEHE